AGPTTFCQGGSVTLNANTGTGLSYQWSINGSPITGANSASYVASTSGSYTVAVSSSPNCSATSSPVTVLVNNNSSATIEAAICQGQTYTFGSQSLTSAGTYNRTIPSANGCDSVITLTLSIKQPATSAVTVTAGTTVCGQVFSTPGTFTKVCPGAAANGCDSIITLTVNPAGPNISTTIGSVSGCVGDTVIVPVTISMASGISTAAISMAIDYDSTKLRCISAVTGLNANIATGFLSNCGLFTSLNPNAPYNASTRRQFRAAWFNLTPVAFNGLMFNVRFVILASGSSPVIWDLSTPGNCEYADEVADVIPNTEWINGTIATGPNCCTATASISPAGPTTFCQGGSVTLNANTGTGLSYQWSINGSPITGANSASYVASTSGSYTVAVSSSPNCSATSSPVAVLVKNNSTATIEAAICQGQTYTFGSQSLTSAGTYNRTVTAANGCDSVITLTLAIKPNASSNISAAICQGQSYTFGSQSLTSAGTYNRTVTAANGCDSVITLTLAIKPNASSNIS
ncbi:MAG: cohesin domain-containing protein, partial [Bacteroidota bacterium]